MNKILLLLSIALLISACQSLPHPQNIPHITTEQWYQIGQYTNGTLQQSSLLAIENVSGGLRFVQTDALGAPIARQLLTTNGWQNDGFVMPNTDARQLYTALLPILSSNIPPIYPQLQRYTTAESTVFLDGKRELWRTSQQNQQYHIAFPNQTDWVIQPIQSEDTP